MEMIHNYIDGKLIEPLSGEYLDNFDPSTGKAYSKVARSKKEDVDKAIEAAKNAFPSWSQTPTAKRIEIIRKVANLIKEKESELALAESIDNGKPLKLASTVDIPRCSMNFEYFCDAMTQHSGEVYNMDNMAMNYTTRQPLGPVAIISPWNLPLYLLTWKIAPALVTGNTVVAKPSEVTPMTAFMLSKICIEAGLPAGVLNIIHGLGAECGDALTNHTDIKAISFTGSTGTGREIAKIAAKDLKKCSLEMGGKNPNIIFADADLDKAVNTTIRSSFANQGQICLCGSRIFVEESIYNEFKERLLEKTSKLKIGNPREDVDLGAVVSKEYHAKILSYIQIAKDEGGTILCGGNAYKPSGEHSEGYYVEPTLIEGLDPYCKTNQDEIFGPVATLIPFKTEKEVIDWANCTEYGLAGSLWTKDIDKAHRVAGQINSGVVWINTWMLRDLRIPFGGMKSSGMGREGGYNSINFFTEIKNICFKINGE